MTSPKGVSDLTKTVIKARQMGLRTHGQERLFWEGVAFYGQKDMNRAEEFFSHVSQALNWEITNKRRLYHKRSVSAEDVIPTVEQDGAVRIWTLMSSENGDFEWAKAVRDVVIGPMAKWSPPPKNVEFGIVVVSGRGTVHVDGQNSKIFAGDIVAVPPNMAFSLETMGHFPMHVMLSEAYPDVKGSELAELEPGIKYTEPWLEIQAEKGIAKERAQSAFDTASAAIEKAKSMGIDGYYQSGLCYDIARKCLAGGNFDAAFSLSHIANDWVQRYIKELEENKALFAQKGVMVANRMNSEVTTYHNETCPAYTSAMNLPFAYHEFVLPFEVVAGNRLGPHHHSTEELYYVLNGRGMMMIAEPAGNRYFDKNQPAIEANPGTLLSIPVMSIHSIYPAGSASLVHSVAIGSFLDEKNIVYDIKMDVESMPWTPESWRHAYNPE
jgi:mannose-6-phosphate isomerase-like protein (cupin superfamily)